MSYYIYHTTSSRIAMGKGNRAWSEHEYPTEGAAKAALTRIQKKTQKRREALMASDHSWDHEKADRLASNVADLAIAESRLYHDCIEQFEEVVPMFSKTGKTIRQSVNTPAYMDPSRESYWTM